MGTKRKQIAHLLALFLVLTQVLGILHRLDSDAHKHGHGCELCAHLSTIDHGLSPDWSIVPPTFASVVVGVVARRSPFTPIFLSYDSRAPPFFSSSEFIVRSFACS